MLIRFISANLLPVYAGNVFSCSVYIMSQDKILLLYKSFNASNIVHAITNLQMDFMLVYSIQTQILSTIYPLCCGRANCS